MVSSKPTIWLQVDGNGKPHEDLVNGDDAAFTKRWGRLCEGNPVWDSPSIWRDTLRGAWQGDEAALNEVRNWVQTYMLTSFVPTKGRIEVVPKDFLGTVLLLFLRDHAAGNTAICANPDCRTLFIKTRNTAKLCGLTNCTLWNLNRGRLTYYYKKGKKLRQEKTEKAQNRRRKAS